VPVVVHEEREFGGRRAVQCKATGVKAGPNNSPPSALSCGARWVRGSVRTQFLGTKDTKKAHMTPTRHPKIFKD